MNLIYQRRNIIALLTLAFLSLLTSNACLNVDTIDPSVPRAEKRPEGVKPLPVMPEKPQNPDPDPDPDPDKDRVDKDPPKEIVRCVTPSECAAEPEDTICCVNAGAFSNNVLNVEKYKKQYQKDDDAYKGICASSCDNVKPEITSAVALCTQRTSDTICPSTERCGLFNAEGIGRCVPKVDAPCNSDSECGAGEYCLTNDLANSIRHTTTFAGKCTSKIMPRALCNTKNSRLLPPISGMNHSILDDNTSAAIPYCFTSSRDHSPVTDGSQQYGRIGYICRTDTQCSHIGGPDTWQCMWKTVDIAGKKPAEWGICQKSGTDGPACVSGSQKFTDERCYDKGLTCCRIGTNESPIAALGWHCADTTASDGSCLPFDVPSGGASAKENYGKCVVENKIDSCHTMYGPGYTCSYAGPPYINSICTKN